MKFLILIKLFLVINGVTSEQLENVSATQCIVKYLANISAINSTSSSTVVADSEEKCDKIIKTFDEAYEKDIVARLKAEDDQTCILKLFRDYKIFELFLKGFASHSLNITRVSDFNAEAKETTSDILKAVQAICTAHERYGKMFNDSLESLRNSNEAIVDSSTQLCIKKYYFENRILDPVAYKVDVSEINATDCDLVVMELDKSSSNTIEVDESLTFYGLPSAAVQRCSNEKFVDQKVLLKLASFEVAVKLGLTKDQTNKLRSDYVTWMTANVRFLLECLEKLLKS